MGMFARLLGIALLLSAASANAAEITRQNDGWISIKGLLTNADGQRFIDLAATVPGGTTVILESDGGSAGAAVLIGDVIRRRGWATVVYAGKTCASACAFAWLAGNPRLMDRDAMIGFHGVYVIENGKPVVSGPANAVMGSYLAGLGLPPQAIFFMTDAKPEGMNWISVSKAKQLGVDVFVLDRPMEQKRARKAHTNRPWKAARGYFLAGQSVNFTAEKLPSMEECRARCASIRGCVAISFNSEEWDCYLKRSVTYAVPNPGYASEYEPSLTLDFVK